VSLRVVLRRHEQPRHRALRQRGERVVRRVPGAQTSVLFRELLGKSPALRLAGSAAGFRLGQLAVRVPQGRVLREALS
jgi:hypothetical protein